MMMDERQAGRQAYVSLAEPAGDTTTHTTRRQRVTLEKTEGDGWMDGPSPLLSLSLSFVSAIGASSHGDEQADLDSHTHTNTHMQV